MGDSRAYLFTREGQARILTEAAAKKVLTQLERLLKESTPEQIVGDATWAAWVRLLDSALLGGAQSTLVGVAVVRTEAAGAWRRSFVAGKRW